MADLGLSTSSSNTDTVSVANEIIRGEPPVDSNRGDLESLEPPNPKKMRINEPSIESICCLEDRLTGILCCTVCLDLPTVSMFQVLRVR